MSITVLNISKFYGNQAALKEVSFQVNSGQIVGFLGPNGAGKSTMMKILTGFISPSEGEVSICGYDVAQNSIEFRKKIGYLPENNPLYPEMYVEEYLDFIGDVYGIHDKKRRIDEVVALTGLVPERHKKIGFLSKGYRQRVGLAQALLPDPEVLILDEPTTGLDPNQISGVRDLIKELGKSKTILLSTHIMQEVKAICERTIIIHKGKIVADEHPDNLESLIKGSETVVEAEFDPSPEFEQIIAVHGVKKAEKQGSKWILTSSLEKDIRPGLFRFAVANGLILLELKQKQQTLEEVFHSLTL
ncbi:MAG TPA: gliding motility-associated ABC transporter ATP-binding subunit GldA [Marinilabiliaceae bacterium]|nr:gliding motility-associated ABC transporter ATP-binding subunit GldA [Marinilabiliaceae bacterium]